MVTYKVIVSRDARTSLREIYDYLKTEASENTAKKVRNGILDTIDELATMPHRHGIVHDISDDLVVFRNASKWSYRIIFNIHDKQLSVRVVEIIHSKRNPNVLIDKFG